MERNSNDVMVAMLEIFENMESNAEAWKDKGTKTAAARLRKDTLALDKLGKEFRKLSVVESKA